jgi:hypothetical protein
VSIETGDDLDRYARCDARAALCVAPGGRFVKICRVEKRTRFSDAKIFSIQRRRLASFGETRSGKSAV